MAFVCVHKTTKRDSSHGVTGGELCLLHVHHYRVCVFFSVFLNTGSFCLRYYYTPLSSGRELRRRLFSRGIDSLVLERTYGWKGRTEARKEGRGSGRGWT